MRSFYGHGEAGILSNLISCVQIDKRIEIWACKLIASPKMKRINETFANHNQSNLLLKAIYVESKSIVDAILKRSDFKNINEFKILDDGYYQNHPLVQAFYSTQLDIVDELIKDERLSVEFLPEVLMEIMLCCKCEDTKVLEMLTKINLPKREKGAYDLIMIGKNLPNYSKTIFYLLDSNKVLLSEQFFATLIVWELEGKPFYDEEYLNKFFSKRERQIKEEQYDIQKEYDLFIHYWIFYNFKNNKNNNKNITEISEKEKLENLQKQFELIHIENPLGTYFSGELYVPKTMFEQLKDSLHDYYNEETHKKKVLNKSS